MIVVAESRDLQMSEVLQHPLGPLPWSLATSDGSLRKTNKSALAKELQKNALPAEDIGKPSACIIDGMSAVQKIKGDHKSFAEIALSLLSMILHESPNSKQIDVVFDVYKEYSIKKTERSIRTSATIGTQFKNIAPGHKVQQWRKFLANSPNKKSLIKFLTNEWKQEKYRQKLLDKTLFIAYEDVCIKLSRNGEESVLELGSTQEEANTRLFVHASHAASSGFTSTIITSEDTDVFILCLYFRQTTPSPIFFKCGSTTHTKFVDIIGIADKLGQDVCRALPGLHAFTGCDTVSALVGRGKIGPLKMVMQSKESRATFPELGEVWEVQAQLFQKLCIFTCHTYMKSPGTDDVHELRYRLFCQKRGNLESNQLPPCADCLKTHCMRANYRTKIWKLSLQ